MEDSYELHLSYRRLFESKDGEKVLCDLERRGFYREPIFPDEAIRLAFNEGRRSMVLHVKQMLKESNFSKLESSPAQNTSRGYS